jgi:hypothetical protein
MIMPFRGIHGQLAPAIVLLQNGFFQDIAKERNDDRLRHVRHQGPSEGCGLL